MTSDDLPAAQLQQWEETAIEFARLAGAEIVASLGRTFSVRYKTGAGQGDDLLFRDPVSEVDQRVESLIRLRLAELYPDHGIIGEEMEDHPAGPDSPVWAIDPVDGTTNFVNGLPLFAASIGLLHRGRPVIGAVWCSTSHALRSGVYHACGHGPLELRRSEAGGRAQSGGAPAAGGRAAARPGHGAALGNPQDRIGRDRMRLRRRGPAGGGAVRTAERLGRRRRAMPGHGRRRHGVHAVSTRSAAGSASPASATIPAAGTGSL